MVAERAESTRKYDGVPAVGPDDGAGEPDRGRGITVASRRGLGCFHVEA